MSITQSSHITKLAVRTEALANIKLSPHRSSLSREMLSNIFWSYKSQTEISTSITQLKVIRSWYYLTALYFHFLSECFLWSQHLVSCLNEWMNSIYLINGKDSDFNKIELYWSIIYSSICLYFHIKNNPYSINENESSCELQISLFSCCAED